MIIFHIASGNMKTGRTDERFTFANRFAYRSLESDNNNKFLFVEGQIKRHTHTHTHTEAQLFIGKKHDTCFK